MSNLFPKPNELSILFHIECLSCELSMDILSIVFDKNHIDSDTAAARYVFVD